jgi:hypothetical protein
MSEQPVFAKPQASGAATPQLSLVKLQATRYGWSIPPWEGV